MSGRIWDHESITRAAQKWAEKHGGEPPTARHWSHQHSIYPCQNTVYAYYPTWAAMLTAAGLTPRKRYGQTLWTEDKIIDAILEWTVTHGRPPKAKEWKHATADRPGSVTVRYRFGSWNNGLKAAGITKIYAPHGGRARRRKRGEWALRDLKPKDVRRTVPVQAARRILETAYKEGWTREGVYEQTTVTVRTQYRILMPMRVASTWRKGPHRNSDPVVGTKYGFVVPELVTVTEDTLDKLVVGLGLDLDELYEAAA